MLALLVSQVRVPRVQANPQFELRVPSRLLRGCKGHGAETTGKNNMVLAFMVSITRCIISSISK